MIYIPIDRKTIRHNPDAGQRIVQVPGHMTMEISGKITDADLINTARNNRSYILYEHDGVRVHLTGYTTGFQTGSALTYEFRAVVMSTKTTKKTMEILTKKFGKDLRYTIDNHLQEVELLTPQPQFLLKYKKIKFACPHCGAKGLTEASLLSDTFDDGEGGETYVSDMCPHCSEVIDIQHEHIPAPDLEEIAAQNEKKTRPKARKASKKRKH